MYIVFDLDGTLCDLTHRLHHIQGPEKDWDKFYQECVNDAPKSEIIKLLQHLEPHNRVQIWSGRSDVVRNQTVGWLYHNGVNPNCLARMRNEEDFTSDVELKRSWLQELRDKRSPTPHVVFDDRQRVVDMWREEGITCCQVAKWEEA